MLRNPAAVGAVLPSSQALARRMVRGIDFNGSGAVLELGPGTGPFTAELQRQLKDRRHYLGIEINSRFIQLLRERYPEMNFVEGSAEEADRFFRERSLPPLKAIISGLPFASLPIPVQDGILKSLDRLMAPGVTFRTFQYAHAMAMPAAIRFRRRMKELFGRGRISRPVLFNFPAAVVLSWQREA